MKKATLLCVAVLISAGLVCGDDTEKKLEVESILADAQNIFLTPAAPARAGRLVALSEYLASLQPTDVDSLRFLCEVCTSRGMFDDAKKYAAKLFDQQPESYQAANRWLKFELDGRQTAPKRIELLDSILKNAKYSAEFRSNAATQLAGLYSAQGDVKKSKDAIKHALQLDPTDNEAILSELAMTENPSNQFKVKAMLQILRGNPRNWAISRDLAILLNDLGLPELSAKYYSLAWAVVSNGQSDSKMTPELAIGYINALLSDNKPDTVINLLSGRLKEFREIPVMLELYVEALKASGAAESAILPIIMQLRDAYKSQVSQISARANIDPVLDRGRKTSPELSNAIVQLGIFYLTTANKPELAGEEFARAKLFGASGDSIDMLQAVVAVKQGDAKAVESLTKFAADFPYADLIMAKYYAKSGDTKNENKFLAQGLHMGRGTRVSRALRAMWKSPSPLPQADDFNEVSSIVKGFDAQVLYMATHPKDFVKVSVKPVGAPIVSPGEAIYISVTVTNTGQLPISFGETGMLSTQVALGVVAPGKTEMKFYTSPIITLPAGKYLAPGKSVSGTTRLDTAQIAWYLSSNPLSTVQLNVKAYVNPIWDSRGYVQSTLPMIEPGAMVCYRAGLLATGKLSSAGSPLVNVSAEWYSRVLGAMNETLAGDNLPARFRTARQIADLLAYYRAIQGELATLPRELSTVFRLEPVMALAEKVVQDKSPVVRAEFVAAMNNISTVTPEIINVVGPIFQDPSPLVRLRLAEFLGNVGGKGNMDILQMFAADKNDYVNTMAKAYLFYDKNRRQASSAPAKQ